MLLLSCSCTRYEQPKSYRGQDRADANSRVGTVVALIQEHYNKHKHLPKSYGDIRDQALRASTPTLPDEDYEIKYGEAHEVTQNDAIFEEVHVHVIQKKLGKVTYEDDSRIILKITELSPKGAGVPWPG